MDGRNILLVTVIIFNLAISVQGLYFASTWCPFCKQYAYKLRTLYENVKDKDFKVIFISSDRSENEFKEFFGDLPWYAVDYDDSVRRANLTDHFDVTGLPALILLDSNGDVITEKGLKIVRKDPEGNNFPWKEES